MKKTCCKGYEVVAHLLSIGGIYLLSAGLIGSFKFVEVIRGPIFWGLFLILAGFHGMGMMMHKKK